MKAFTAIFSSTVFTLCFFCLVIMKLIVWLFTYEHWCFLDYVPIFENCTYHFCVFWKKASRLDCLDFYFSVYPQTPTKNIIKWHVECVIESNRNWKCNFFFQITKFKPVIGMTFVSPLKYWLKYYVISIYVEQGLLYLDGRNYQKYLHQTQANF